jgi:hypothetical protein
VARQAGVVDTGRRRRSGADRAEREIYFTISFPQNWKSRSTRSGAQHTLCPLLARHFSAAALAAVLWSAPLRALRTLALSGRVHHGAPNAHGEPVVRAIAFLLLPLFCERRCCAGRSSAGRLLACPLCVSPPSSIPLPPVRDDGDRTKLSARRTHGGARRAHGDRGSGRGVWGAEAKGLGCA